MSDLVVVRHYVECLNESCLYRKSCSTHKTAGDFRSEDGFKPLIIKKQEGLVCFSRFSESDNDKYYPMPQVYAGWGLCLISEVQNEESDYQI